MDLTNRKPAVIRRLTSQNSWLIAGILLVIMAILCVISARTESATCDEGDGDMGPNCYVKYFQYEPNQVIGGYIQLFDLENLQSRTAAPAILKIRKIFGLADRSTPPDSCP